MIVGNKCVEKATGSIIVLILTDERECCRWEGPLIARVTAGLAGLNNPINPHIVSSLDLTKPRVNGLYPVTESQPFFRPIMQVRVRGREVSIGLWSLTSSCLA